MGVADQDGAIRAVPQLAKASRWMARRSEGAELGFRAHPGPGDGELPPYSAFDQCVLRMKRDSPKEWINPAQDKSRCTYAPFRKVARCAAKHWGRSRSTTSSWGKCGPPPDQQSNGGHELACGRPLIPALKSNDSLQCAIGRPTRSNHRNATAPLLTQRTKRVGGRALLPLGKQSRTASSRRLQATRF